MDLGFIRNSGNLCRTYKVVLVTGNKRNFVKASAPGRPRFNPPVSALIHRDPIPCITSRVLSVDEEPGLRPVVVLQARGGSGAHLVSDVLSNIFDIWRVVPVAQNCSER